MKDTKEENALLIPSVDIVAKAYDSEESLEAIIAAIEKECRAEHYTVATREGRDRIKSQAYKISRSKTAMDEVGKGLTEEANNLIKRINGRRKIVTSRLDALKDEIRAPLTKWEEAEDKRKQDIKDRIAANFGLRALPESSAALRALQDSIIAVELDDTWQEFLEEATKAKDSFLRHLAAKIHDAERAEERERQIAAERAAQEAELARLREAEELRRKQEEERAAEQERHRKEQEAKDAELAKLRAELEAMKQQPMPAPVGIVGTEVRHVISDQVVFDKSPATIEVSSQAVKKIDMSLKGDNFFRITSVIEGAPNADTDELAGRLVAESVISRSVLTLIEDCETQEEAADRVTKAILEGKIPFVRAVLA